MKALEEQASVDRPMTKEALADALRLSLGGISTAIWRARRAGVPIRCIAGMGYYLAKKESKPRTSDPHE